MNSIAVVTLLLALGQPASVQLTLDEALAQAVKNNTDLAAARAKLEQARQGVWKAWSGYMPSITASGAATWNEAGDLSFPLPTRYYVRDMGSDQGPAAGADPDVPGAPTPYSMIPYEFKNLELQKEYQFGGQIEARQALFVPMLWGMISAATHGVSAAEYGVESARREILFGVSQLFYGAASLRQVMEVQQRLFDAARKHEKDADVRYRAGTIPKVGLLRAQMERAKAEQDLVRGRNAYESVRLALATALARDADFEVVDPAEPGLPDDLSLLEEQALRDRPDLKSVREAEAAARGARWGIAGKYLPAVVAFGRFTAANVGGFTGEATAWSAGLAASWNILDGGLREAELREANAMIAEAEATRRGAELKARLQVKQAILELQSARANALKAREGRDLAVENMRLIDVSYAAGSATSLEQTDAQTALRGAEIAFASETLAARLAAIRVLLVAGIFDPAAAK